MTKQAIICARVSSDDPERERLDDQLAECRKWAEDNGYTVVDQITENGVSGGKPFSEREAGRALALLREGKVDVLIWREIDRMGRRFDTAETIEECQRYGDGILFVRQPAPDDPIAEILQRGMGAVLARWERANIYRRTSGGRNRKAREGTARAVGTLPMWLEWTEDGYRLKEPEATHVRQIIDRYGAIGGETLSVEYGLHPSTAYRLLRNPIIAGRRYISPLPARPLAKQVQQRQRREALREIALAPTAEEADAIAGRHGMIVQEVPALCDWARFAEIQRHLLSVPSGTRGRPPVKQLPLQGRIYCGQHRNKDGKPTAYTPTRGGKGRRAVYAACTRRTHGQRDAERCDHPRIPWTEDTPRGRSLVSLVHDKLAELLESPEAIKEACEDYLTALTGRIDQLEACTGDVSREIAHWEKRQAELGEKWAAGDLSDRALKAADETITRKLADARQRAQSVEIQLQQLERLKRQYRTAKALIETDPPVSPLMVEDHPRSAYPGEALEKVAEKVDLRVTVETDRLVLDLNLPLGDADRSIALKAQGAKVVQLSVW